MVYNLCSHSILSHPKGLMKGLGRIFITFGESKDRGRKSHLMKEKEHTQEEIAVGKKKNIQGVLRVMKALGGASK